MQETRSGPALVWLVGTRRVRPRGDVLAAVALLVAVIGVLSATVVAVSRGTGAIAVGGAAAFAVAAFLIRKKVAIPLALILAGFGLTSVASDLVEGLLRTGQGPSSWAARPIAVASACVFPLVGAFGNALMLTFPTGSALGRWRWALRAVLLVGGGGSVAGLLWALSVPTETLVASALGGESAINPLEYVAAAIFLCFPFSLASLFSRYRRGSTEEKLQIRWLFFSFACLFFVTVVQNIFDEFTNAAAVTATTVAFLLIPVSIGVAILKYRLYDIDRIISRTVAYAITASVVAAVYAAPVVLIPAMFDASNDVVIAGSTLAAASVFNPVRKRVKRLIERRFSRLGYNPEVEIGRAGLLLRDNTDLDGVGDILNEVLDRTLLPAHTAIWVRRENHNQ